MPWTSVRVRPAVEADVPVLVELAAELREQVPGESKRRSGQQARYADVIADPDRHLVIAVDTARDGSEVPLGMALFTVAPVSGLLDVPAVHVQHAVVADRHKRQGAGRALVAAAAAYAEERGIDELVVSVHPGSRDANRFFARLGFAPLAVRRAAPVSVVRRKLQTEATVVDHVVRRRPRRVRAAVAPAVPLGPAEPEPRT